MAFAYLVTPERDLPNFVNAIDREYFAKPIEVEVMVNDGYMCTVTDHARGHTYPALRENLKSKMQLTNRQREAAGIK